MTLEYFKGKKVVVTGATGLIGSYAIKLLRECDTAQLVAHSYAKVANEFTEGLELYHGDLMDPQYAGAMVHDMDVCVNCAGITGGIGLAHSNPIDYVGPATVLACNVIHACYQNKVRLGFLSSTTVYAPQDQPVEESDLLREPPFPLYAGIGYSKRFLEQLCRYYHEKVGLEVAIVRPSGAFGRYDNFDEKTSHVLPGMVNRALREKEVFEVWGDGNDVRDLVHAEDIARGFLLAIALAPNADPINLASGKGITTLDLARTILRAVGSDAEIVTNPNKPVALKSRLVNIRKANRLLGYVPQISLERGIQDTVDWFNR